jgi:hypothetical protein
MKIIKPGREQKSWAKEFKCTGKGNGNGGCEAILLVEKADLFYTQEFEREGGGSKHTGFECPQCHVLTDIPDNFYDIPHYQDWKKGKRCDI